MRWPCWSFRSFGMFRIRENQLLLLFPCRGIVELFAEIDLADRLVVAQLFRNTGGEHIAVADDIGMVAGLEGLPDVVVRDQNTDVPFLQNPDDVSDFAHSNRVDAGERFVKQNEFRTCRK